MGISTISTPRLSALLWDVAGELFGDSSRADEIRTDVSGLLDLIAPTGLGNRGRSFLTRSGAPFELSVKTRVRAAADLRWVVDVADHDLGLAANRDRYLDAFTSVSAATTDVTSTLLDVGLCGAPADVPPRVMIGVGHATTGRRTTLYLPTIWWDPKELRARLRAADPGLPMPEVHGASWLPGTPDRVEVTGWDFNHGSPTIAKTYRWLRVGPNTSAACRAAGAPLGAATTVIERFGEAVPGRARDRAGFLQLTGGDASTSAKLFLFSQAWGWSAPDGMLALLRVTADLGVDLGPLQVVRTACVRHEVTMELGLLAVGGPADDAVITWYFWPVDARLE